MFRVPRTLLIVPSSGTNALPIMRDAFSMCVRLIAIVSTDACTRRLLHCRYSVWPSHITSPH